METREKTSRNRRAGDGRGRPLERTGSRVGSEVWGCTPAAARAGPWALGFGPLKKHRPPSLSLFPPPRPALAAGRRRGGPLANPNDSTGPGLNETMTRTAAGLMTACHIRSTVRDMEPSRGKRSSDEGRTSHKLPADFSLELAPVRDWAGESLSRGSNGDELALSIMAAVR